MTLDFILGRRSIRRFTTEPVDEQQMETLLRAAMAAPSAGNQQPWQFVVIRERPLLEAIPPLHPYAAMAPESAAAVLVCGDFAGARYPDYWVQDCAAATENLLLAAHALSLGAVWCGVYPAMDRVAAFRELFDIPERITPMALVCLGHPGETKPPAERYDPQRVHQDRW
jgi:nitroreductase